MTGTEIPLEDLISFMDEPLGKVDVQSPQDNTSQDDDFEPDDTEDNDDTDDSNDDTTQQDQAPTIPLTPDSNIHDIFETVKDEVLLLEDNFKFDGTVEGLKDAFVTTYEKLTEKAKDSLLESLPEDYKLLVKYGLTTKKSVADFFEDNKEISYDWENIDLTDVSTQKSIIAEYLSLTTKYTDEKIRRYIETLENTETLATEASDTLAELIQLQEEKKSEVEKNLSELESNRAKQAAQERKVFETIIDEDQTVPKESKSKLKAFLNNRQISSKDNSITSNFSRSLRAAIKNPKHLVQLADILMDYDEANGFSFDKLVQRKGTDKLRKIKKNIEEVIDPKTGSVKTSSPKTKESFNWETWAQSF